jgi:hypothetical protein
MVVDLLVVSLLSPGVAGSSRLLEWLLLLMEALAAIGWWLLRVPFLFVGRRLVPVIWVRSFLLIFVLLLGAIFHLGMCLRENLYRDICKDHLAERLGNVLRVSKVLLLWNES